MPCSRPFSRSVDSRQSIKTALGNTLTIGLNSTTGYNYPSTVCPAANSSCLATGQIVDLNLSLLGDGSLVAQSVTYADACRRCSCSRDRFGDACRRREQLPDPAASGRPGATSAAGGSMVTIAPASSALFTVPFSGYPVVNGASFAGASDLVAGQEVLLQLGPEARPRTTTLPAFISNLPKPSARCSRSMRARTRSS